jgi:hypothetical protein
MKRRFQRVLKLDPIFIEPLLINNLLISFSLTIHNSQFTIHNFHHPSISLIAPGRIPLPVGGEMARVREKFKL